MDGVVLNFDSEGDSGLIRASDGNRYRFAATDWSSSGGARQGDVVDFEPIDGRATEIFVTKRVPISGAAAEALSGFTEDLRQRATGHHNGPNPLLQVVKDRPALIAAGLILLASFLPFVTLPSAAMVGFEGGSYNLYSSVMKLSTGIGMIGTFAPASVSVPLRLIYLLLAIPAAAAYLLYRELIGTADTRLRFRTGLLAAFGPIGIPVCSLLLAVILGGGSSLLGGIAGGAARGMSAVSGFFGFGLMLTMASGIALVAVAKGWNPIKALIGSFVYLLLLGISTDYGAPSVLIVGIGGGTLLLAVMQGWSPFDQLGIDTARALPWSSAPKDSMAAPLATTPPSTPGEADTQFCSQCGHRNDPRDRFCAGCGAAA